MVWNLNPTDNGTFTCQVKNPPDVDGMIGEIQLRVVQRGTWPGMVGVNMKLADTGNVQKWMIPYHVWGIAQRERDYRGDVWEK